MKKEIGKQIKIILSDMRGDFTSAKFKEYCEEYGINNFVFTTSVTKRKNRIGFDMVQAILKEKNRLKEFKGMFSLVMMNQKRPTSRTPRFQARIL